MPIVYHLNRTILGFASLAVVSGAAVEEAMSGGGEGIIRSNTAGRVAHNGTALHPGRAAVAGAPARARYAFCAITREILRA